VKEQAIGRETREAKSNALRRRPPELVYGRDHKSKELEEAISERQSIKKDQSRRAIEEQSL